MPTPTSPLTTDSFMLPKIGEFTTGLHQQGAYAALKYLNGRTPHRYTGVFRFDGDQLRSEILFDRYDPNLQQGDDALMEATYCFLVGRQHAPLEIGCARQGPH